MGHVSLLLQVPCYFWLWFVHLKKLPFLPHFKDWFCREKDLRKPAWLERGGVPLKPFLGMHLLWICAYNFWTSQVCPFLFQELVICSSLWCLQYFSSSAELSFVFCHLPNPYMHIHTILALPLVSTSGETENQSFGLPSPMGFPLLNGVTLDSIPFSSPHKSQKLGSFSHFLQAVLF